jgi:anti-sigma regulatory factor (Ser/Thr protein kinase)
LSGSVRIPVEETSQPAEARRRALRLAADLGFDEVLAGRVAIVALEVSTNILKHAGRGEILLQVNSDSDGSPELELIALDKGPGMANLELCIEDGYTTGTSYGGGLGAIRRLAHESDFFSVPGEGTAVLARWKVPRPPSIIPSGPRLRIGSVNVSKPGEEVCGDAFAVEQSETEATVMLADGLGHGYYASQASQEAVRILHAHPQLQPGALLDITNRALRGFRGAAVSIARLDHMRGKLVFSGLGNVAGHIYRGPGQSQHLVSVNGTAGQSAPHIREFSYAWPDGGILVMHSDGLLTHTSLGSKPALAQRDASLIAGVLYRDFSRGHDDATVVVAKAA